MNQGGPLQQLLADITIAAPPETVWAALRDPARIRTWFGWDAPTLDDEIKFIFLDNAEVHDGHRITFAEWEGVVDAVELDPAPEHGTRLRVLRTGGEPIDWQGAYHDVPEGWITFFQQLRLALEVHPDEERRTIYLSGAAQPGAGEPSTALGLGEAASNLPGTAYAARLATGDSASGLVWHQTHFQTGLTVEQWGNGLLVITDLPLSPKRPYGGGSLLVTTYGLSDSEFTELEARWTQWWNTHYQAPKD